MVVAASETTNPLDTTPVDVEVREKMCGVTCKWG